MFKTSYEFEFNPLGSSKLTPIEEQSLFTVTACPDLGLGVVATKDCEVLSSSILMYYGPIAKSLKAPSTPYSLMVGDKISRPREKEMAAAARLNSPVFTNTSLVELESLDLIQLGNNYDPSDLDQVPCFEAKVFLFSQWCLPDYTSVVPKPGYHLYLQTRGGFKRGEALLFYYPYVF